MDLILSYINKSGQIVHKNRCNQNDKNVTSSYQPAISSNLRLEKGSKLQSIILRREILTGTCFMWEKRPNRSKLDLQVAQTNFFRWLIMFTVDFG